jgi:hypothetical protein
MDVMGVVAIFQGVHWMKPGLRCDLFGFMVDF